MNTIHHRAVPSFFPGSRGAVALGLAVASLLSATATASIVNGDFEQGNVGFTSDHSYVASGSMFSGQISVRTSAATANGNWCQFDHDTGSGSFLLCDGSSSTAAAAWRQTVSVCQGETYVFRVYVNNLVCSGNFNDPLIVLRAGGVDITGPLVVPETPNQWIPLSGTFVATSNSMILEIRSNTGSGAGNDYGIDDITVLPASVAGPEWWKMDDGLLGAVRALEVFDAPGPSGPELYAGGIFPTSGGIVLNGIARWDGKKWQGFGPGVSFQGTVYALAKATGADTPGTSLYAGGFFTSVGGVAANGVARWDGTTWYPLGTGITPGFNVRALAGYSPTAGPQALYAGGAFTIAGGVAANNIARWNGSSWTALGSGLNGTVHALQVYDDGGGPDLYAGGFFTTAGGAPASNIARWNGSSWSTLGTGVNSTVYALTVFDAQDGLGPRLIASGSFTNAGGVAATRVAAWNGTTWSALGSGFDTIAYSLAVSGDGTGGSKSLYAGGQFYNSGSQPTTRIAKWTGTSWVPLATGINPGTFANLAVYALREYDPLDGSGTSLIAGGEFTVADTKAARSIARWGVESANELRFDGLDNLGLGDTQLTRCNGELLVMSTPSTGPTVRMNTKNADGICVSLKTEACPTGVAQGNVIDLAAGGTDALGATWSSYLTITKNSSGGADFFADFTSLQSGSSNIRVNTKQPNGTENYDYASQSSVQASVPSTACIREIDWIEFNEIESGFSILFDAPTTVTVYDIFGTVSYLAERVWFAPEWPVGFGGAGFKIDTFEIENDWTNSFVIGNEFIQLFDVFQRGLGKSAIAATQIAPGVRVLDVTGIGSSGQDGVEFALGKAASCDVEFDPIDPGGTAANGAFIEFEATGSVNGVTGHDLGQARFTKSAGAISITANFSAIGSPTELVQVLQGGALVANLPGQGPSVGTASAYPIRGGKLGGATECIVSRFPAGTSFVIAGNAYIGDELRILAQGVSSNIDSKSSFAVRLSGIGSLRVTDVDAPQQSLTVNSPTLSISAGGTQYLFLNRGPTASGDTYLILGSASGTMPGLQISQNATLPLNLDSYLLALASNPNTLIANSMGTLDGNGKGVATIVLPPASLSPTLAGLVLHHAALVIDNPTQVRATSNAVSTRFVP